jgi:hypothetical protein
LVPFLCGWGHRKGWVGGGWWVRGGPPNKQDMTSIIFLVPPARDVKIASQQFVPLFSWALLQCKDSTERFSWSSVLIKNPFILLISMPRHHPYGIPHAACNQV